MAITHEFWDFIEKYLPNYSTRDDVLRHSELQLFIDGQESTVTDISIEDAEKDLSILSLKICDEAINSYTKGLGECCEHCKSQCGGYCKHCGKKLH